MSETVSTFRPGTLASEGAGVSEARERARVEGYMAGFAAGAREAAQTATAQREAFALQAVSAEASRTLLVTERLAALDAAAAAARARTAPVIAEAETALYDAALELAQAIIAATVDTSPGSPADTIRRALSDPTFDDVVSVRMHPADVDALNGMDQPLPPSVTLRPDATLQPGDAIAEHPVGFLDARLSTAVARARAALAGVR